MNEQEMVSNVPLPMGPCDHFTRLSAVDFPARDATIGPNVCISIVESGKWSMGMSASAIELFLSILVATLVILLAGYILGFLHARIRLMKGTIPSFNSADSYHLWRRERTAAVLTFMLVFSGLLFFAFGVSGTIELQIPYARVVTSVPGIVIILFGYLFWTRRFSSNSRR